jgi:hypothetical protein
MIESDVVTLRLPAQSRYVRIARLVGAGLANDLGVDLDGLDDVRLAIGEVCGLASQLGAAAITLTFAAGDGQLRVTGDGRADASPLPGIPGDEDQLRLVHQILDVACAEHELALRDDGLAFSLTFAHGA